MQKKKNTHGRKYLANNYHTVRKARALLDDQEYYHNIPFCTKYNTN